VFALTAGSGLAVNEDQRHPQGHRGSESEAVDYWQFPSTYIH